MLLIIDRIGGKNRLAGKIFDYIRAERTILGLVPSDGIAAEFIKQTNTGVVVDPEDIEEIKGAILSLYQKWEKGQLRIEPNWDVINQYERKALTMKLAQVFDSLV